jgi:hypothetical protein
MCKPKACGSPKGAKTEAERGGSSQTEKKKHGARKHSQNRTACKNQKKLAHFLAQKEPSFYSIKSTT